MYKVASLDLGGIQKCLKIAKPQLNVCMVSSQYWMYENRDFSDLAGKRVKYLKMLKVYRVASLGFGISVKSYLRKVHKLLVHTK